MRAVRSGDHSTLTLREYEGCEVSLSHRAYMLLRSRFRGQIDIGPTDHPGVYHLAARDHVGRVILPDGRLLVIQPKVGLVNLFYMLCADSGLARFHPPPTALAENPDIFAFVLAAFLARVGEMLAKGLYRAHVSCVEDLPLVRGRIMFGTQVSRHADLKHRHTCLYADMTTDTPENRVIAAALRYVPSLLKREEREPARLARRLLLRFEGVSSVSRQEAISLLPGINLHRLNAAYGPVLGLCRLVLHHLSLDERAGPYSFASFLVEMPRLFESFVTARLRALLPAYGLRVVAQRHDYLDEDGRVGIRPDVLVFSGTGGLPLLVLDAKYRRLEDGGEINRDLYQVSAYLDRYGLQRGVLVYPQLEMASNARLKLRGTPKHLHVTTVDLSASDPVHLEQSCAQLAASVADLALAGRNATRS